MKYGSVFIILLIAGWVALLTDSEETPAGQLSTRLNERPAHVLPTSMQSR